MPYLLYPSALATLLLVGSLAFGEVRSGEKSRQLVLDVCTSCHEFKRVRSQHLSREEWQGLIKGMISEGSPVTDEEMTLIVDYLAAHFGPETP